ncbi:hypothetical protein [Pseudomonas syringae]|uniref:hypothetical protein n=1 Tax=Pseudomonas syringae TaxID=317 RepID=UPI000426104E|nr:hypothetical protein [Pseudomonas syringae]
MTSALVILFLSLEQGTVFTSMAVPGALAGLAPIPVIAWPLAMFVHVQARQARTASPKLAKIFSKSIWKFGMAG